jgi:hypothetical protein
VTDSNFESISARLKGLLDPEDLMRRCALEERFAPHYVRLARAHGFGDRAMEICALKMPRLADDAREASKGWSDADYDEFCASNKRRREVLGWLNVAHLMGMDRAVGDVVASSIAESLDARHEWLATLWLSAASRFSVDVDDRSLQLAMAWGSARVRCAALEIRDSRPKKKRAAATAAANPRQAAWGATAPSAATTTTAAPTAPTATAPAHRPSPHVHVHPHTHLHAYDRPAPPIERAWNDAREWGGSRAPPKQPPAAPAAPGDAAAARGGPCGAHGGAHGGGHHHGRRRGARRAASSAARDKF